MNKKVAINIAVARVIGSAMDNETKEKVIKTLCELDDEDE